MLIAPPTTPFTRPTLQMLYINFMRCSQNEQHYVTHIVPRLPPLSHPNHCPTTHSSNRMSSLHNRTCEFDQHMHWQSPRPGDRLKIRIVCCGMLTRHNSWGDANGNCTAHKPYQLPFQHLLLSTFKGQRSRSAVPYCRLQQACGCCLFPDISPRNVRPGDI